MARGGITYTEVANVCNNLQAQGLKPTVDRIREQLGTGSRTTINDHKKTWESRADSLMDNPDKLSDNITRLVSQLSDQIRDEHQHAYDRQRKTDQAILIEKDNLFDEAARRLESVQEKLDRFQIEIESLKSQRDSKQIALDQSRELATRTQTQLVEKENQISLLNNQNVSLEDKLVQSNAALEHFQNSAREQREQDRSRWDNERSQLAIDIKQQHNDLALKNTQISELNRQNGELAKESQEYRHQLRQLEDFLRDQTNKIENLEQGQKQSHSKSEIQQTLITELTQSNTRMETEITSLQRENKQVQAMKEETSALFQQLMRQKDDEITRFNNELGSLRERSEA